MKNRNCSIFILRNFEFLIRTDDDGIGDGAEEFTMDREATRRELSCWLERPSNYLIFAELFAFQNGEIEDVGMTYEWFQKSDCQITILIYCKQKMDSRAFYTNAVQHRYTDVEWVKDDNNPRTSLAVWK